MKINRQEVYDKCGGKCGYCGVDISINKFQVDHIVSRFFYENNLNEKYGGYTDPNHIDNLMPTCSVCNKWKSSHSLEQFRKEISLQLERLNNYNSNYRFAKKYNLINETPHEILFYFEKLINN
jgi:5-methylcytosine-specific restriction endonuclease McrA